MLEGRQFVPRKMFFTKGIGVHREKLTSFEMALRDARVARYNLVRVSSIFLPTVRSSARRRARIS
jgi:arginine decarboxylase